MLQTRAVEASRDQISVAEMRRCALVLVCAVIVIIAVPEAVYQARQDAALNAKNEALVAKRASLVESWRAGKIETAACVLSDGKTAAPVMYKQANTPLRDAVAKGFASGACSQG